jgi:hypothetical protein
MRNFIGGLLISIAWFIGFMRNALIFTLLISIGLGIFLGTLLAFMDLVNIALPSMHPEYDAIDVFKRPVVSVIVFVLGMATMGLGIQKMSASDKEDRKKYNENYES